MTAIRDAEDQTRCIAHIDDAVSEVFETMLRQRCAVVNEAPATTDNISAKVIFSGTLQGYFTVRLTTATADRLTDAFLGAEGDWDDEMIEDAVGELCNMIAGGWKSRLSAPASVCHLSVPSVSRSLSRETSPNPTGMTRRFYAFDGLILEVALALN